MFFFVTLLRGWALLMWGPMPERWFLYMDVGSLIETTLGRRAFIMVL
jgi:hypothetical protein